MKFKNIIVAGGGTAGFISALVLKRKFGKNINVKMLVPDKIGIIGVGEGSTEHFDELRKFLDLSEEELIQKAGATGKAGIKFDNWMKDHNYYHVLSADFEHLVGADNKIAEFNIAYRRLRPTDWMSNCFVNNEVEQLYEPGGVAENKQLKMSGLYQYHFNTFKLNEYLTELAKKFNIEIVDDEIKEVRLNNNGEVDELVCEKGNHKADFYIDSTGFKRVIMNKLGAKWVSYGDQLPLKEAIAFPTGDTENYAITTLAKAMNYGWRWRIPTFGRHGNGYIYDTDFINKDQAVEEIEKEYGHEINVAKNIKFDPGKLDKVWIKNCYAVGLSANFIEPLEATSIGTSINQAFCLMHFLPDYSDSDIKIVNKIVDNIMDNVRDFVRLHYINDRRDTPFWQKCAELPMSDYLKHMLEVWKSGKLIRDMDYDSNIGPYSLFTSQNFNMIAAHHGLINSDRLRKYFDATEDGIKDGVMDKVLYGQYRNSGYYTPKITHKEYIQQINDKGDHYKVEWPETELISFEEWKKMMRNEAHVRYLKPAGKNDSYSSKRKLDNINKQ